MCGLLATHAPLRAVITTALVVMIDQSLKLTVRHEVSLCQDERLSACEHISAGPWLRLVSVENAGSAFGFAQGLDLWTLLAFVSLLLVPLYGRHLTWSRPLAPVAIGLQVGGAASNLLDRLLTGGVVDYMMVPGIPIVINLADIALVAGAYLAARELRHGATLLVAA
jgi:signal peptidase II